MRRASSMPRERRADPRQEQRERTAELKREKAARQFLLNHRLRHALAPRTGEKLDLDVVRATLDAGARTEGPGLGPGEAPGSAIAVLIGARADTETARAAVQLLLERGADAAFREEGTRRGLLHAAAAKGWTEAGLRLLV